MRKLLIISVLFSLTTYSQQWSQKGQTLTGEAAEDFSGTAVDISDDGNVIAIGAYFNQGNGYASGHCRLYEWDGFFWQQKGNDIDGVATGDNSGISVALSSDGNTVLIGAYAHDGPGTDRGQVRVFSWNGSAWVQKGSSIYGEADGDFCGVSVAVSDDGNSLIAGSYKSNAAAFDAGQSRVFQWNGSSWVQKGANINGEAFGDQSGFSVAINSNGNTVVVGDYSNNDNGSDAGQVRVFDWSGSSWVQKGTDLLGEAAGDLFGNAVSLSSDGNTVAVGARKNDANGTDAGHARIFEWSGSAWSQKGVDLDGDSANDNFGVSIALNGSGDTLVVGADKDDGSGVDRGFARVYVWTGSSWTQWGTDFAGVANEDWFGVSSNITSDGLTIAVGGYGSDESATDAGHTKVFQYCQNSIDETVSLSGITLTANAAGNQYQWIDCDNGNAPINGETNQSFTPISNGNYAVMISNGNCTVTSACEAITTVGVLENTFGSDISVYPNPTQGDLTIDLRANYNNITIEVKSMTGQVIQNNTYELAKNIELNINGAPGLYLINIRSADGENAVLRIVKE